MERQAMRDSNRLFSRNSVPQVYSSGGRINQYCTPGSLNVLNMRASSNINTTLIQSDLGPYSQNILSHH